VLIDKRRPFSSLRRGIARPGVSSEHEESWVGDPQVVRFGTFELDHASGELRSQGKRVALQSQPAQVLALLVRHPGQVVTREELRRAVWSEDTFVGFDTALNVAVNKIRLALRDSASTPRFIETVPKRGYRFLAEVYPVEAGPPPTSPRKRRALWTAAALAAVLAAAGGSRLLRSRPPAAPRSVAVLPFKPLTGGARDEALELGMAEAVIVKLAQLKRLRVPSVAAVRRYAGPDPNPLQAGRELGVEAVLDGSLLRVKDRLRVSARLLDVETGTPHWARQWDLPWTDVFAVQDAMATEVAQALALTLAAEERSLAPKPPTNTAAYESFLRARYLITRRTLADSQRAAELLEEAAALDPGSAPAQAALADAYLAVPWLGGPVEPSVSRARQAARRALELDPTVPEAHAVLGSITAQFDWDPAGAEPELKRALGLEPDNPVVLRTYSAFLWQEGRFEEALALNRRELALDPTSVFANRNKAIILYYARRYDECVEQCRQTLELDRYFLTVYDWLGRAYENMGRHPEAMEAFLTPRTFFEKLRPEVASLRAAAEQGGFRAYWKLWLELERHRPDPHNDARALAHLRLGDRGQALALLEQLAQERAPWIRTLGVEPLWDPLRAEPRFQALLRRVNLDRTPSLSGR
jgi:TolB-like protein/DNA-binding winged helix-turn-helix (wHTH) protein